MSLMLMQGNAKTISLADESVHCCVTSPPYWNLRDYGISGQLGLESTPEEYVANMVAVFREVKRVLRADGTCWLNLGDSYAGSNCGSNDYRDEGSSISKNDKKYKGQKPGLPTGLKPKDLCGIPWRVAFAFQADGWWLRSDIIWSKPNPMPESVTDRPTKAHEYLFLLTKSAKYFYDADAVREPMQESSLIRAQRTLVGGQKGKQKDKFVSYINPKTEAKTRELILSGAGRNRRTVWQIATAPYSGAHFATYPPALVEPCIKAGTSERGVCPECGAPWERVSEKGEPILNAWSKKGPGNYNMEKQKPDPIDWDGGSTLKHSREHYTLGWQRTCECGTFEPPIPATVFDPFAGSGTTLQVARALGRNGVGLDLSLEYLQLARTRLSLDALDAWTEGSKKDGNGKDNAHKNKQMPGRQTHSFHEARNEKDVTDLPMFEEMT